MSTGYERIVEFYGDKTAKRSGVPLINHINEGLEILDRLHAHPDVKEAFCIHPMIQADPDLLANYHDLVDGTGGRKLYLPITANVLGLAMEYRNIANAFLSDQIDIGPDAIMRETIYPKKPLVLSPLAGVNMMLVADKVQNRKDFIAYHQATHARSRELTFYFDFWLKRLEISEQQYQDLIKDL